MRRRSFRFACLLLCLSSRISAGAESRLTLPNRVQAGEVKECDLAGREPKDVPVRKPDLTAKGKMIVGGGGWDTALYKDPFVKEILKNPPEDMIPVIMSAAQTPEAAGGSYAFWQKKTFGGKVKVRPIFTTPGPGTTVTIREPDAGTSPTETTFEEKKAQPNGNTSQLTTTTGPRAPVEGGAKLPELTVSTSPDNEGNIKAIQEAKTAIIIDGGKVGSLAHLAGTKLAAEIQKAYQRGVTIFVSSEGANASAAMNASLLWARSVDPVQSPQLRPGLAITNDFGVSSHAKDPRLISARGFGKVVTTEFTMGDTRKKIDEYTATNPYAFLQPLKEINADYPVFGVPERAAMYYQAGVAEFKGEDPDHRFYIIDPRYPATAECAYYYVLSGTKYDLTTGKIVTDKIVTTMPDEKPTTAAPH